jgi:hypothetical protein
MLMKQDGPWPNGSEPRQRRHLEAVSSHRNITKSPDEPFSFTIEYATLRRGMLDPESIKYKTEAVDGEAPNGIRVVNLTSIRSLGESCLVACFNEPNSCFACPYNEIVFGIDIVL